MAQHKPRPGGSGKLSLRYRMTEKQSDFARHIANGVKVVLFIGGIRAGKTHGLVAECLKQVYVYDRRPNLGWIVSPTFPMSKVPEQKFRALCWSGDRSCIAMERRGDRAFLLWPPKKRKEYWRVEMKSADEPDRLRGSSLGFAGMDEAAMMTHETFQILQGRVLDSKGIIMLSTTPRGKNWVYEEVYKRSLKDPRYATVICRTDQNQYLEADEIGKLRGDYLARSSQFARQELDAQFVTFEGLVFSHYDHGTHTVKPPVVSADTPVYCGVDWGFNDPFVCVWFANIGGVWVLLDEYYKTQGLIKEHIEFMRHHHLASQVRRYWCDPSRPEYRKEMLASGFRDVLPARRPKDMKAVGWPEARARLMNNLFAKRLESPFREGNSPGLVFASDCTYAPREFSQLSYRRFTASGEDGIARVMDREGRELDRNAGEQLEDKANHVVDAAGYCLYSEIRQFGNLKAYVPGDRQLEDAERPPFPKTPEELRQANHEFIEKRAAYERRKAQELGDPWDTIK